MTRIDSDPRRWERLNKLLDAGLDLPPDRRAAWLAELDVTDADRTMIASMLARASETGDGALFDALPPLPDVPDVDADADALPGDLVGNYRLKRHLGSGGMADVWLADRDDGLVDRPVALKLPQVAGLGRGFAERLERERDILASLTHPNIARLYDAGLTVEQRPFLAIEYVEGAAIDAYCQREALGTGARVDLFIQAARAVGHAHANLVLHRDLKPANILVTNDGVVKLLDFGIAALLDQGRAEDSDITRASGRMMTPDFASPEQIRGDATSIQSDVYSLGVVLYVLLTGRKPYVLTRDSAALLEEAVLYTEPPRPSDAAEPALGRHAARALRGDLDAVVLKALKKRPGDRYATVDAFIDDLERHRSGHPVVAQPDRRLYRAGKFVRRHRRGVAMLVATGLVMTLATVVTVWQLVIAQQQRDLAQAQQQRVQAGNEFLSLLLEDVGIDGRPRTMVELLDRGVAMLDRQYGSGQPFIGRAYLDVARRFADLSYHGRELELLTRAERFASEHGDRHLLAAALCESAATRLVVEPPGARIDDDVKRAFDIVAISPGMSVDDRVACELARARLLVVQGQRERGIDVLLEAQRLVDASPATSTRLRGEVLEQLSEQYLRQGAFGRALDLVDANLALQHDAGRDGTVGHVNLLQNKSSLLGQIGEIRAAADIRREILARVAQVSPGDAVPVRFRFSYAVALLRLSHFEEALALLYGVEADNDASGSAVLGARIQLAIGRILARTGRTAEAADRLRAAEVVFRQNARANAAALNNLVRARAEAALADGDPTLAGRLVEPLLDRLGYPDTRRGPGLVATLALATRAALARSDAGAFQLATDMLAAAEAVARQSETSADVGRALALRARARLARGETGPAARDLARALPALTAGLGPDNAETLSAERLLAGFSPRTSRRHIGSGPFSDWPTPAWKAGRRLISPALQPARVWLCSRVCARFGR